MSLGHVARLQQSYIAISVLDTSVYCFVVFTSPSI